MDLFDLVAKITLDSSGYEKGTKEAQKGFKKISSGWQAVAKVAEKAASKIGYAFGKSVRVTIKALAAGVGAGSVAVTKFAKDAIKSYADYEQLVGGVTKLFGENANAVMKNAANAYKTAGLSANEYMETVTSFSATLISALEGDTKEAARIADMAMIDMADNANTFGTDIASIQAAYQGFAKQNYTMLDNLKLGYGGTASEMARLINESGILQGEFIATAENVKDIPFDIMIQAIHQTQKEMKITGTTAKEAMSTISGSVNAAKGAWKNLITGIADEDADLNKLIDDFLETIIGVNGEGGVINNILPAARKTLDGLSKLISTVAPKLIPLAVDLINQNMPMVLQSGSQILAALLAGLASALPALIREIPSIVKTFVGALKENWPEIKKAGVELLDTLGEGISSVWNKAKEWGAELVAKLVAGIKEHLHEAWEAFSSISGWNFFGGHVTVQNPFSGRRYAKAYDTPYLFSSPTVVGNAMFGDGPGAEMVYGKNSLMRDIREATGGGKIINFNPTINIDGGIDNAREKAQELMYEMKLILDREAAAYA